MATTSSLLKQPVTETANVITADIDVVDHLSIVRMLRQSDDQLWSGYLNLPCVYDKEILRIIDDCIEICKPIILKPGIVSF
jgi:hypothetical protein